MCLNRKCAEEGRCDFCDARCMYYVDTDYFFQFIEVNGIDSFLHDITMKKIESSAGREESDT